jgi:hypothetical protein
MVNQEIFHIADKLKSVVDSQMNAAKNALLSLPEGETKAKLMTLLKQASTGKLSHVDAQRELDKIVKHVG